MSVVEPKVPFSATEVYDALQEKYPERFTLAIKNAGMTPPPIGDYVVRWNPTFNSDDGSYTVVIKEVAPRGRRFDVV